MIRNFTEAEWRVLCSAIDYYQSVIDDDPARYGAAVSGSLGRAYDKARQLAPERGR